MFLFTSFLHFIQLSSYWLCNIRYVFFFLSSNQWRTIIIKNIIIILIKHGL